jgi:predicted esterase
VRGEGGPYLDNGYIVVTPYNRDNIGYTNQIGEDDVWRVMADIKRTCRIDDNRVYLTGLSMGGGGTLHIGLRYPDRFAAIAPVCGWSDWRVWAGDHPPPELRQQVLDSGNILSHAANAFNLPVKVFHGGADSVVSVEHSRILVQRLRELDYDVEYEEYPGVGHNSWDNAYENGRMFAWFDEHVRDPSPGQVTFRTASPRRYGKSYWTRVTELETPYEFGQVKGEIVEGNRIVIRTENVARFALDLSAAPIDTTQKVEIEIDGEVRFRGVPAHGVVLIFGKEGGEFKPVAADGEAGLIPFNGTEEAMSGWRIFVYGTQGSAGENRAARETAERLAAQPRTVDITFPVKADTAITAEDIERASLILLGTPASNAVLARIEDQLPVRFGDDGITLGGKTYDGEDRLVVLVYPNPLRPDRYVVILGATSPGAYDGVHGLGWGHPDYSIRDAKGEAIVEGNFDIAWQPANN